MFHSFCTVLMLVLLLLLFVLLTLRALCISSPLFDVCFFLFREINLANTQRIRIPVPECNVNCPLFSLFSFWFIVRFFFASFIRFSPSTWTTEPGSCWCSPLSVCCLCVFVWVIFFFIEKEFQHDFSFFLDSRSLGFIPFFALTCLRHFSYRVENYTETMHSNMQVIKWLYAAANWAHPLDGAKKCVIFVSAVFLFWMCGVVSLSACSENMYESMECHCEVKSNSDIMSKRSKFNPFDNNFQPKLCWRPKCLCSSSFFRPRWRHWNNPRNAIHFEQP